MLKGNVHSLPLLIFVMLTMLAKCEDGWATTKKGTKHGNSTKAKQRSISTNVNMLEKQRLLQSRISRQNLMWQISLDLHTCFRVPDIGRTLSTTNQNLVSLLHTVLLCVCSWWCAWNKWQCSLVQPTFESQSLSSPRNQAVMNGANWQSKEETPVRQRDAAPKLVRI